MMSPVIDNVIMEWMNCFVCGHVLTPSCKVLYLNGRGNTKLRVGAHNVCRKYFFETYKKKMCVRCENFKRVRWSPFCRECNILLLDILSKCSDIEVCSILNKRYNIVSTLDFKKEYRKRKLIIYMIERDFAEKDRNMWNQLYDIKYSLYVYGSYMYKRLLPIEKYLS